MVGDAQVGYNTMLNSSLSNHSICSGVHFPYWPSFLLLFESIAEQISELEDAIDVDGKLLAISLPLEVPKYGILGTEVT